MSPDDVDYLEQRAEAQLELARKASDPRAVQAHYDLATAYLDRIHGEEAETSRPPSSTRGDPAARPRENDRV